MSALFSLYRHYPFKPNICHRSFYSSEKNLVQSIALYRFHICRCTPYIAVLLDNYFLCISFIKKYANLQVTLIYSLHSINMIRSYSNLNLIIAVHIFCTDDLSYNKVATQINTYNGQPHDAQYAVDRIRSTCMRTNDIGGTSLYQTMWWKVDLGGVYNIYSINILFKNNDAHGIWFT